ncbi:MAG: Ig-like domain-containing protein [Saccharospirillaceae bacterium]|nr:Ig-like domain-containing protein [Pseudomonadales bacterium]NRB79912.1 Ig-like domain-containing protein [Saccharospirillaceae bacterium]
MKNKTRILGLIAIIPLILSSCELTEEDEAKLNDAQVDLEQLADQIIITYPANNSLVTDSIIIVRADIPAAAEAQEIVLYVDGIEVAKDTDGAPWEISWPAYYWADGGAHTLLLKTITGGGNEVRNNQQFQVNVDILANNLLQFKSGIDGLVVQGENSLLVEFNEFPGATKYELKSSDSDTLYTIDDQSMGAELTDLEVGEHELSYRAILEYSELTTLEGPWSYPVSFEVSGPDLPVLNSPEILVTELGYDLLLSWEDLGEGNAYKIQLDSLDDNSISAIYNDISNSELLISGLQMGEYQWILTRSNPAGHESIPSEAELIKVGVFTKYFGGSKDDRAKQIIHSRDGGFIILAKTKSSEVSDIVDSQGDDWIIKLNNQGDIEWDYVSNASGRDRLNDIVELEDGSIVLVGSDWDSKKALAIKLDNHGVMLWEIVYRPEGISMRYDFNDIVEFNNTLYVSSREWGPSTIINYYLHAISQSDGSVSTPINIPSIEGLVLDSAPILLKTSSGNLLLSGYAEPEINPDFSNRGAYIQVLDASLNQITVWSGLKSRTHGNVGDVIELSNSNFAVIGQGVDGGEPNIAVINNNGVHHRNFDFEYGKEFYNTRQTIVAGDNGKIYGLFKDSYVYSSPSPLTFMTINSNVSLESQSYLLDYKDYVYAVGLLRNKDDSFILLIDEAQNGSSNYDIVVVKSLMQ